MNARQITTAVILAAATVVASHSLVAAQPWRRQPASDAGQRQQRPDKDGFEEIIKELGLTPEQQQKLTEQRKDEKIQAEQLRQRMQDARDALSRELDKDQPDRRKVRALIREMKAVIGARLENKVDGILAMKSILTPEQMKILNEKTKVFDGKRGGFHDKESHHRFDRNRFGRGYRCPKFCQRLG